MGIWKYEVSCFKKIEATYEVFQKKIRWWISANCKYPIGFMKGIINLQHWSNFSKFKYYFYTYVPEWIDKRS